MFGFLRCAFLPSNGVSDCSVIIDLNALPKKLGNLISSVVVLL